MEFHRISDLLKELPERTLLTRVSHLEDIQDWKDKQGVTHDVVVLGFRDEGAVIYTGTCVLKGKDAEEIAALKNEIYTCWTEDKPMNVRFTAPSADAPYTWPEVWFVKELDSSKDPS